MINQVVLPLLVIGFLFYLFIVMAREWPLSEKQNRKPIAAENKKAEPKSMNEPDSNVTVKKPGRLFSREWIFRVYCILQVIGVGYLLSLPQKDVWLRESPYIESGMEVTVFACLIGPLIVTKGLDWVLAGKDKDSGRA